MQNMQKSIKYLINRIFLVLIVCYPLKCFSQNIYLLQGQTFLENVDEEGKDLYPVLLYNVKNDSLVPDRELTIDNSNIDNIRMYFEQKKIIIHYYPMFNDTSKYCSIDFKNQMTLKNYDVYDNEFNCYRNYLINKNNNIHLLIEQSDHKYEKRRLIGLNFQNQSIEDFIDSDLQYYISDGYQGIGVENIFKSDKMGSLYIKAENDNRGQLFYYIKSITDFENKYKYPLPDITELKKVDSDFVKPTPRYGQYVIKINTRDYLILQGKTREYDGSLCKGQYLIYDKGKEEWSSKDFKGSYPTLRAYGNWLAGTVVDDIRDLPDRKNEIPIPGKKYRVQEKTEWGSPADVRFKELLMHPYGILFLYNLKASVYIEWEALENGERQGDSEILYVENNTVIYRIDNKIYKAEIGSKTIEHPKLLIANEKVPYIHWAFITGN